MQTFGVTGRQLSRNLILDQVAIIRQRLVGPFGSLAARIPLDQPRVWRWLTMTSTISRWSADKWLVSARLMLIVRSAQSNIYLLGTGISFIYLFLGSALVHTALDLRPDTR